jgi:hypothetical protein
MRSMSLGHMSEKKKEKIVNVKVFEVLIIWLFKKIYVLP